MSRGCITGLLTYSMLRFSKIIKSHCLFGALSEVWRESVALRDGLLIGQRWVGTKNRYVVTELRENFSGICNLLEDFFERLFTFTPYICTQMSVLSSSSIENIRVTFVFEFTRYKFRLKHFTCGFCCLKCSYLNCAFV